MILRNPVVWAVLFLASSSIVACSSESSSGSKLTDPNSGVNDAYLKNSCLYTADEGDNVTLSFPASDVQAPFFQKRIDLSRLEMLGNASTQSTASVLLADGVNLFKIPTNDDGGCRSLGFLTEATRGLQALWTKSSPSTGNGKLLGLFLPTNRVADEGFGQPVIMVRDNTDRYTVVHEYMHFLFNREREKVGQTDGQLLLEAERVETRWQQVVKNLPAKDSDITPSVMNNFVDAWLDLANNRIRLMENFSLEEISVESLLTRADRSGRLARVSDYDRENSKAYIEGMLERASSVLSFVGKTGPGLEDLAKKYGAEDRVSRIRQAISLYESRMDEARNLAMRYGGLSSTEVVAGISSIPSPAHGHTDSSIGCGREALWKKIRPIDVQIPWIR